MSDLAAARAVSLPVSATGRPEAGGDEAARPEALALTRQLANLPLFSDLDPAILHALVQQARPVELAAGKVLFRQGDDSKSLFVVVDGAVVPIAEGGARRKLAVLERGAFVGEIGLVTRQPRNATVTALVDSTLLAIDRTALLPVMRSQPVLAEGILRPARERMLDRQLRTHLFFASFPPAERSEIARRFRIVEVRAGAKLVEQGRIADALYVVLAGSFARIERPRGRELGHLGIGELVGGRSLLEGKPAACDVVANGRAWVLVLGERRFRRIIEENPRLVRVVERLSAAGARASAARCEDSPRRPEAASLPPQASPPPHRAAPARAASGGRAPRSRS
ncbi:MAG: cyclic nucleotide-binding domain-containing protein [Myxococcota bacterium]